MNIIKKIKSLRSLSNVRNGVVFAFFSFLNQGISFILTMFLVSILTKEDFGNLNLFNTLVIVVTALIPLGSMGFVSANFFLLDKKGTQKILTNVYAISLFTFGSIFVIFLLLGGWLENLIGLSKSNQILVLIICFCQLYSTINLEIWRLQEKPLMYGLYTTGIVLMNVCLTLLFIVILDEGWEGRVYALLTTNLIFFIISFLFLCKRKWLVISKVDFNLLKKILIFGLPLVPHILTGWMRQGIDKYFINYSLDLAQVAVFSFALNLSNIIQIIGIAFNASNSVFIFKHLSNSQSEGLPVLIKQIKLMLIFFAGSSILIGGGSSIAIPFFFPKYVDSIPLLFPLCLSAFFQCVYLLFVNFLFFYKKTRVLMYITVGVSLFHIFLSYNLTKYSICYTAYINLLSNLIIAILVMWQAKKILNKNKLHSNE